MRRLLGAAAALLMFPLSLYGQAGLSGLKICIDPGHGGHNPDNDRHVVPDPGTDFWESESNFQKALLLDTLLTDQGATVLLTRYTNDYPGDDDPSLSQRVAFANANNVEWFHSIHSNATGWTVNNTVNRTLMLVREEIVPGGDPIWGPGTGNPEWPEAWDMSNLMGPKIVQHLRTQSTSTWRDWTFYGGSDGGYTLGVLRGLLMPGQLSEGSFHDYFPETRRLMNNHYRKMEALALRDAFMAYFNAAPDSSGTLAGMQSDIATGSPVNYTRVTLQPGERVYNGDRYNNGFYMFEGIPPGLYTVRFETPGFHLDSASVTVLPGGRHVIDWSLVSFAAPTVTSSSPAEGEIGVLPNRPITLAFSKPMDITSVMNAFSVTPPATGSFSWARGNSEVTFSPDSILPFYADIMIVVDTSARSVTGEQIDGDGDGTPGDPYVLLFNTGYVDAVPPYLLSVRPAPEEIQPTPGDVLNLTFSEPLDPMTVNVNNFVLRESTGALQLRTGEYVEASGRGGVSIWLPNGTKAGATYSLRISNIADTAGNTIPSSIEWEFSIHPDPVTTRSIDSLVLSVADWTQPLSSPHTKGVDSARFSMSALRRFPPGWGSAESALLAFAWDTTSADWLLHLGLDSSRADAVRWSAEGSVLQSYVHGDGSGTALRFVVDDSLHASPGGSPTAVEVSRWINVDWVGWRLLEWDFQNDSPGSWVGDGSLDGEIRLNGIQLSYLPGSSMPGGELHIAAVQVAERVVTSADTRGDASVPLCFAVHQNYPNPFNPSTRIAYELPRETWVRFVVYDLLGRRVATLVDRMESAGFHHLDWHGADGNGHPVTSGLYFGRFEARDATGSVQYLHVNKMLFVQ